MEVLVFLAIIAGVIYLLAKRGKPEVTDWGKQNSPNSSAVSETPAATVAFTVTENEPKYYYNPSEDVTKFLRALIYVGKADGQLREDETMIMAEFLKQQQPEHKQSDIWYLSSCIRDIKPFSTDQYNQFIRQLDKNNMSVLLGWYKKIMGTQKKNHPFEDHLLAELQGLMLAE